MKIGSKTLKGDHIKTATKIQKNKDAALGSLLALDPASRSVGFAWYVEGELVQSGSIDAKGDINTRLAFLRQHFSEFEASAIAIEFIGGSTGHRYLSWACGALAASQPDVPLFEIKTNLWKKFAGKDWFKDDEQDAIAIGKCVLEIANELA